MGEDASLTIAERISTSKSVKATAPAIFYLVRRPKGHVQIDGSGMLLAAPDAPPVSAVCDTLAMPMDRRPFGDIPDMAEYDVTVIMTDFKLNALIEWSVMIPKGQPYGHVYGCLLEPQDANTTLVSSYCDWSGLPEKRKDPAR